MPRTLRIRPVAQPLPLNQRLLLIAFVTVTAATGMLLHRYVVERGRAEDAAAQEVDRVAALLSAQQSSQITAAEQLLLALRELPQVRRAGDGCPRLLRSVVRRNARYSAMGVADGAGDAVCSSVAAAGVNVADRDYFQAVRNGSRFAVSRYQTSRVTGKPVIHVASPVDGPDGPLVLIAAMDLSWLALALEDVPLPQGAAVTLTDAAGRVLVRHPALGAGDRGRRFSGERVWRQLQIQESVAGVQDLGLDGVQRLHAGRRLTAHGRPVAYLVVSVPTAQLYGPARRDFAEALATSAVMALLLWTFAVALGRRFVYRPVTSAIERTESRFRTVVANAPVVVCAYDTDGRLTLLTGGALGGDAAQAEACLGRPCTEVFAAVPEAAQAVALALQGETVQHVLEHDGRHWDVRYRPLFDDQGGLTGALSVGADVTSRVTHERLLARSEERHRSIVETALEGVWVLDERGDTVFCNASLARLLEVPVSQLEGAHISRFLDPSARDFVERLLLDRHHGGQQQEVRLVRGDRIHLDALVAASPLSWLDESGERSVTLLMITDVTALKETQEALAFHARHDGLTGLVNRAVVSDRLEVAIGRATRTGQTVAVLHCDIDRFTLVNDSFGHRGGDALLRQVAKRLTQAVPIGDTVARLAGDEFLVISAADDLDDVIRLAEDIQSAVNRPFTVDGHDVIVSLSMGVAAGTSDAETLLLQAAAAARSAKTRGGSRFEISDAELRADALHHLQMRRDLAVALDEDQLRLQYQPLMCLTSGATIGAEALVRWEHPTRGWLMPGDFLALAEETGLSVPLGTWVIRKACEDAARWPSAGSGPAPYVSVNLAPQQLRDGTITDVVRDALDTSGLASTRLMLEVSERTVMADAEDSLAVMESLRAIGVRLAIDDFGTGYSSLSYLRKLPVDSLKIDRSFIDGLGRESDSTAIVATVVALARAVGMTSIAEGVEDRLQQDLLWRLGADYGQGFFWRPALPAADFEQWLTEHDSGLAPDLVRREHVPPEQPKGLASLLRHVEEQRSRVLAEVVSAQEHERMRIAGDLHDDSIQVMTAVSMQLEALSSRVKDDRQRQALGHLSSAVHAAVDRLRQMMFNLLPPDLEHHDLGDALRHFLDQQGPGVEFRLRDRLGAEPPHDLRVVLYRIAQEAVTNVCKHAHAREVAITLIEVDGGYLLDIADDGVGATRDAIDVQQPKHIGITSMRERAETCGGWLRVDSTPGAGTTVRAWLPAPSLIPAEVTGTSEEALT